MRLENKSMTARKAGLFFIVILVLGVKPVYGHGPTIEYFYPFLFFHGFLLPFGVSVLLKIKTFELRYEDLLFSSDVNKRVFFLVAAVEQVFLSGIALLIYFILRQPLRRIGDIRALIYSALISMALFFIFFPIPLLNMKYLPRSRPIGEAYLLSAFAPASLLLSIILAFLTYPVGVAVSIFIANIFI